MIGGIQQSCPRSRRSHAIASVLAVPDAAMDGLDDGAYETFYSALMFVADHERMPKEPVVMTLQKRESKPADVFDDIGEVMESEIARFCGCADARARGIRSTVGGVPAGYPDQETGLNFVRRRSSLRERAEEA